MAYADLENLLTDYLPEAKSTAERAAVGRILDNVCTFVDSYCRRAPGYFNPASDEPTMRRVRGEGSHFLRLPVHVFGSVSVENLLDTAFYESEKNGWLYFETEEFGNENSFADWENRIWLNDKVYKVTARWGYAATPLDIQEAVRLIVARLYGTQRGTLGQISVEGFLRERLLPSSALAILDNHKKREFEI